MTRTIAVAALTLALICGSGLAAQSAAPMTCSLTNKTVKKCCCTKKNGKLYCTLAKKTIESCCCTPAPTTKTKS